MEKVLVEQLIYNYKFWIKETQPEILFEKLDEILKKSGYTILNCVDYKFKPQGYTCMWLLAESHLAVHTFPEKEKTYIELSGCNQVMNDKFIEYFNNWTDTVE